MSQSWYPRYYGDYMRDTGDLSLMEDGAYNRLLDHYYATRAPLPANAEQLHRICRAIAPSEQDAVQTVVARFFERRGDFLHNRRADEEISKSLSISAKRRAAAASAHASAGAFAPANGSAKADQMPPQPQPQPQPQAPSHPQRAAAAAMSTTELVDIVVSARPEFARCNRMEFENAIVSAKDRAVERAGAINDFVRDASNEMTCPRNPAKMLRAYIDQALRRAGHSPDPEADARARRKRVGLE